jgi:tRNA nucleotidyltransferase (CCA-adding enzyme)
MGRPHGCRVVGGYLRDRLLGRATKDLDLALAASVDDVEAAARHLAEALGTRAHLLGTPPHQVWRIASTELTVELWPSGGLGLEDDTRRRDFTVNALSWSLPDGPLIDLVAGNVDLEERRLRAISRRNLEDDAVRLLRAPRFLAQLPGFELDSDTRQWIAELAPILADAPRERIGKELLAMLKADAASRGVRECLALGLFEPSAPSGARLDAGWLRGHVVAADRLARARRHPVPSALRVAGDAGRIALMIRAWGSPSVGRLAPYSWPRPDRDRALRASRSLDLALSTVATPSADRRELAWHTGAAFPTVLALAAAVEPDQSGWRRWWRQWLRDPAALERPRPLLTGDEIVRITGIEPGPELGAITKGLTRAQVRREVRNRHGAIRWLSRRRWLAADQ